MHTVDFQPVGRRVEVDESDTLLEAAQRAGVELIALCGGIGACDTCRVRLVAGQLTPTTLTEDGEFSPEELADGWRLACQSHPLSDVKIDVPPESLTTAQRLELEGVDSEIDFDPVIMALDVQLPSPTLDDLRADLTRLYDTCGPLTINIPALKQLPLTLRENDWQVRLAVRHGREIVAVLPPETPLLGFAIDIGTTGLAAYLVDFATGDILSKTGAMNPQIAYGEDVVSRIVYINEHPGDAALLQKRLIAALNDMIASLCQEANAQPERIVEAVLVGNTAMHHIVAGLPVRQLGEAPYLPVSIDTLEFPATTIGLNLAPGATVYMPPVIAGYVGADHIAMLLATGTWRTDKTVVAVDIGTNTEVTLTTGSKRLCCSCASGPAFEGAHIRDGMRAAPGAIERVQIRNGEINIKTIGDQSPVGICGSGILDAVAQMRIQEIVDHRGAFNLDHPMVDSSEGRRKSRFVLAQSNGRTVAIRRKDISEIQLAKSAIRSGIEILLAEAGITANDVDAYIIAGAFGTYIDIESAVRIGMFPDVPLDRYQQVGNAAGMGAKQLLLSNHLRDATTQLARQLDYIELTSYTGFQDIFMRYIGL
jgi:uncharacterized 2Fe-2S/4Fe-4S cluster protein (DUF4445 family)